MVVYIIYSKTLNKFYIGQTENFDERLRKHNYNRDKTSFSSHASDWEEYLIITCQTRQQAIKIESYIKKQKSRKYISGLKANPEWVNNLLGKFPS